jgi:hypothetical protein
MISIGGFRSVDNITKTDRDVFLFLLALFAFILCGRKMTASALPASAPLGAWYE